MSHTLKVKVEITDETALRAVAEKLGANVLGFGDHHQYNGLVQGFGVKLEGWQYPAVFNFQTGECLYDNYNGRWGAQSKLDALVHEYSTEVISQALMARGVGFYRTDAVVDGKQQTVLCYT